MAANWELQLVSSIIRSEDRSQRFLDATNQGITSTVLGNPEAKAVWSCLTLDYNRPDVYGQIPSEERVKEHFMNLELPNAQECFEDLCRMVKHRWQTRKTNSAWESYVAESKSDPALALSKLTTLLVEIQEQQGAVGDISFSDVALSEIVDDMERLDQTEGITGIPYPWPRLNEATGGMNFGDYILIYALPKSMKTWLGLFLAVHVAMTGRKVLVYSRDDLGCSQKEDRVYHR